MSFRFRCVGLYTGDVAGIGVGKKEASKSEDTAPRIASEDGGELPLITGGNRSVGKSGVAASLNASCNLSSENSSANNNRASKDGCCEFVVKGPE